MYIMLVLIISLAAISTAAAQPDNSNITPIEQARMNAAGNLRTGIIGNSISLQNSGNDNAITITQIGTNQQISGNGSQSALIQGSRNQINVNQGDAISHAGQSLVTLNVYGDLNALTANQGTDISSNSSGTDLGDHYQSIQISGSLNSVITGQSGQSNYLEVNVTGNNNNQTSIQAGSRLTAFTVISGNNNTINTTQTGTGQHLLNVNLTGDGNSATVNQSGSGQNRANISLTNAGGPSSVNLTQTGGQVYSISQTCVTAGGCGIVTVRQGN